MDEAAFRNAIAALGYDGPELIERAPHTYNAEHSHAFAVEALVLSGELAVTTAAGTTTCRAGDRFSLAGDIEHSEQYGPDGARVLVARRG